MKLGTQSGLTQQPHGDSEHTRTPAEGRKPARSDAGRGQELRVLNRKIGRAQRKINVEERKLRKSLLKLSPQPELENAAADAVEQAEPHQLSSVSRPAEPSMIRRSNDDPQDPYAR